MTQAWLATGAEDHLRAVGFYRQLGSQDASDLDDGRLRFIKDR